MGNGKAEIDELEKLVDNINFSDVEIPKIKSPTKKRIRRIAEPHLRQHRVKGKTYYTYCRGVDKEIYLGTAEAILKAVKGVK